MDTYDELDVVKLKRPIPDENRTFPAGTIGTLVHLYQADRPVYMMEIADNQGRTLALLDVTEQDIELVQTWPPISSEYSLRQRTSRPRVIHARLQSPARLAST